MLWFFVIRPDFEFLIPASAVVVRERVLQFLADQLGVSIDALRANPRLLAELETDSLDLVELVMEFEEYFD